MALLGFSALLTDFLSHDFFVDLRSVHNFAARLTLGRGERSMALQHILDPSSTLQRVDVLSVVAQQLALLLQQANEAMSQPSDTTGQEFW